MSPTGLCGRQKHLCPDNVSLYLVPYPSILQKVESQIINNVHFVASFANSGYGVHQMDICASRKNANR